MKVTNVVLLIDNIYLIDMALTPEFCEINILCVCAVCIY